MITKLRSHHKTHDVASRDGNRSAGFFFLSEVPPVYHDTPPVPNVINQQTPASGWVGGCQRKVENTDTHLLIFHFLLIAERPKIVFLQNSSSQ
jgi:hypothetical protein